MPMISPNSPLLQRVKGVPTGLPGAGMAPPSLPGAGSETLGAPGAPTYIARPNSIEGRPGMLEQLARGLDLPAPGSEEALALETVSLDSLPENASLLDRLRASIGNRLAGGGESNPLALPGVGRGEVTPGFGGGKFGGGKFGGGEAQAVAPPEHLFTPYQQMLDRAAGQYMSQGPAGPLDIAGVNYE